MQYYVERLTLRLSLQVLLPSILTNRPARYLQQTVWFFDATRCGLLALRLLVRFIPTLRIEYLAFRIRDIHDDQGLPLRLRIQYRDLEAVLQEVQREPSFKAFSQGASSQGQLVRYVLKELASLRLEDPRSLWRALFLAAVTHWHHKQNAASDTGILFLEKRPWVATIRRFAGGRAIDVQSVPASIVWKDLPLRVLGVRGLWLARWIRDYMAMRSATAAQSDRRIRLATDYWGYFNLDRPECYSDFFFAQNSAFPTSRLLATFSIPRDPADTEKVAAMARHGIRPVALDARAASDPSVPVYIHRPRFRSLGTSPNLVVTEESRWVAEQTRDYQLRKNYWRDLFDRENVRIWTSWFHYDASHCAIGEALKELNGIMTTYQRSCQLEPSPEVAAHTDVVFGYSPWDAQIEKRSGSTFRYHVATGYLGDHRFPLLRVQALQMRERLRKAGARYIVAFFDENSHADERWHSGHAFQRENYEFLFDRILSDATLGLVLKPKTPATLRKRLGDAVPQLERALATGRCFLYEEGPVQGVYPPALAALASDVAIHSHAIAVTAGFESALAGIPTLVLDRENWHASPLYALGIGRVVFPAWEGLWGSIAEDRSGRRTDGFGDWSPILDDFDPFRDGRAAERMGTYLTWLLEGLEEGGDRDSVMARAAERYRRTWGQDKVTEAS